MLIMFTGDFLLISAAYSFTLEGVNLQHTALVVTCFKHILCCNPFNMFITAFIIYVDNEHTWYEHEPWTFGTKVIDGFLLKVKVYYSA